MDQARKALMFHPLEKTMNMNMNMNHELNNNNKIQEKRNDRNRKQCTFFC